MNAFSRAASYDCGPAPSPRSVTRGASPGRPRPPTPSPSPCPPRRERPARPWWRRRSSAARSGCAPDAGAGEPRDRPGVAHQRGDSVDPSGAAYQNLGMETRAGQQRRSDAVLGGGREGTGHLRQQVGKGGPRRRGAVSAGSGRWSLFAPRGFAAEMDDTMQVETRGLPRSRRPQTCSSLSRSRVGLRQRRAQVADGPHPQQSAHHPRDRRRRPGGHQPRKPASTSRTRDGHKIATGGASGTRGIPRSPTLSGRIRIQGDP